MDTIVVFIENENKHVNLVHSLNLLNIPFVRLHEGGAWDGYLDKLRIYIDGLKVMSNEWVLLSDSRDVLFYKNLAHINNVYNNHFSNYDILFQGEDAKNGDILFRRSNTERFRFSTKHYKYLCSGLIMGRRLKIIEFFEEALNKATYPWDVADQPTLEWGMAHLTHYNIGIDDECRLFQQMAFEENSGVNFHLHFNKNFIINTYTGTEPSVFHGAGKSFLHPVWRIINGTYS